MRFTESTEVIEAINANDADGSSKHRLSPYIA